MPVATVSTYSVQQTTLNDVSKVENQLQNAQAQLSSGFASQDFAGMASNVSQYLSLDNVLGKVNQYLSDNKVVETRVNTTSTIIGQLITTGNSFQSLLSQRISGVSNSAAFGTQVNGLWQTITGQLNTTLSGQFLFSGSATNKQAVDTNSFPSLLVPGTPDSGYYGGSNQDITARPQDNTEIIYNVRADNPAFQKLFAALSLAKQGDATNNSAMLSQAENLVQASLKDMGGLQATVNANAAQFSTIDNSLTNQQLYYKGVQEQVGNTDIVSVSTQLSINQGILQAAFQAFAKISSLRLSDYLK